ncbi:MAG: hypothetical protein ACRCTD_06115 [Beijerinckiaceae bacterium]
MALRHKQPGDIARAMRARAEARADDDFRRETFALTRDEARATARDWFARYPKQAYMTAVERWRELPDGRIEFTMRRLPSAD